MRIRSTCAIAALALGATVLGSGTADATGPLSGTKIRNWQTGAVLGVAGNSTVGGALLQYQSDTGDLAQKWAIDPVTSNTFLLRNLNSDMCVTVLGTSTNGSEVQQRPCDSRWDEQTFTMIDSSKPSRYQLRNQAFNMCLYPYSASAPSAVYVAGCSASNNYATHSFDVR
ncbi:RICIN domain-containing protein [Kitasatospora sp. NPDC004614]|uniref:RICIN domain-containing protein n=1 Tax=unclassified Kitasatospora TaxID=2633591 RepID=UPI0036C1C6BD